MSIRIGDWLCTHSGISFFPLDPRPDEVVIEDIAHALSNMCRFGGHCCRFYSVAEHSVRAFREARRQGMDRRTMRAVLLHDASEAYLVDVPRPIKGYLGGYKDIEYNLERIIAIRFDFDADNPAIKPLDNVMLATEKRDLMPAQSAKWAPLPEPLPAPIRPMGPRAAKDAFMVAWRICGLEGS